jgi:lipopolysaccharide export system protein LptA
MRVTISGLRRWIVYAAALLLAIVVGFFLSGRARFRHIEKDLPGRLGANIQQTATGFSYSQSSQGHTLFTIKASKLVQLRAGHALLHDVDVTLYGPPGSGRSDRIYGSDFDYDQNSGVATSRGEVTIEIAGIGSQSDRHQPAASGDGSSRPDSSGNTIRVHTSGLTFAQKTGDASTQNHVEFQLPRAAGSSMGATFNSRSGVLVLDSQVHIVTSNNGKSAVVDAQHARLLRDRMQAFLDDASMNYQTARGRSDHATVWFRNDGTAEKIDAEGHVHMSTDSGASVDSGTARFLLDPASQPTRAELGGGLRFASSRDRESMQGSSGEGTLLFMAVPADPSHTTLRHAQFRRQVNFTQQIAWLSRDPGGRSRKQLQAQQVDVDFAPASSRRPHASGREPVQARRAVAEGAPLLTTVQTPSKGPQQTTRIGGDHLVATLGPGNVIQALDATGHTRVDEQSSDGARNTSRGDVLHATFAEEAAPGHAARARSRRSPPATGQPHPNARQMTLAGAVEDGNVILTETPAKKPGETAAPATLTAWAQHAAWRASDQVLHLTGNPRMTDSQNLQLSAETIDYHRDSQDAAAAGSVKVTYAEPPKSASGGQPKNVAPGMGGSGPVHIIAARAELHHATSESIFYGTVHAPARMWQQTDSLVAPIIVIDRAKNRLEARSENPGGPPLVDANFVSANGPHRQQSLVRVNSQTLVYSDGDRRADFRGSVTARQANEVIRCDDALVFLKPAPAKNPAEAAATPRPQDHSDSTPATAKPQSSEGRSRPGGPPHPEGQSRLDRVVATGHVVVTEPGRRGEGEKLVYTADSGEYVLTGTKSAPPRMTDRVHGTTTGEALLFNSQNDSVEVSGGKSSAVTDTRAPK